jgi:hypothetical protein
MTTEVLRARASDLCFAAGDHPATGYAVFGLGGTTAYLASAPVWVPLIAALIGALVPVSANVYRGLAEWRGILAERSRERRLAGRLADAEAELARLKRGGPKP